MNDSPSVTELIKTLRDETTTLVRDEMALAKTELSEKASVYSKNAIALVAGALVAYSALVILLIALGSLLAEAFAEADLSAGMAHFLGLGLVGVVVGIIGAVMVMKSMKTLKNESPVPEKTMETLREDKNWAKSQTQ